MHNQEIVGQHAVRSGESILLPTWTRPQAGQSIPVQNGKEKSAGQASPPHAPLQGAAIWGI